jgi:hypothetical protein
LFNLCSKQDGADSAKKTRGNLYNARRFVSLAFWCALVCGCPGRLTAHRAAIAYTYNKKVFFLNFCIGFLQKKVFLELFVKTNSKTAFFLVGQLQE